MHYHINICQLVFPISRIMKVSDNRISQLMEKDRIICTRRQKLRLLFQKPLIDWNDNNLALTIGLTLIWLRKKNRLAVWWVNDQQHLVLVGVLSQFYLRCQESRNRKQLVRIIWVKMEKSQIESIMKMGKE
jgi:hypothetical protein